MVERRRECWRVGGGGGGEVVVAEAGGERRGGVMVARKVAKGGSFGGEGLFAEVPEGRRVTADAGEERVLWHAVRLAAQIGVAVKGGADLGVYTVQAALDQHPKWVCIKVEEAVAIGFHIQPAKSTAYSPEGDPGFFAEEMLGAHGELDFIVVLGVPVGKAEAVAAEKLEKLLLYGLQQPHK
ncbi:hypothetical protein CYMTET_46045 [Cymbomonas tetramitiformis]|uniref:Uncharacterized protein n=1 Tax=Cymbomonas tetramitiformis TaxID=36881 RepID=A0AAE0BWY1_9CHLO|nr:hypothetical protein CYMTET_46045 [Cymbomonas tetramitiformis]